MAKRKKKGSRRRSRGRRRGSRAATPKTVGGVWRAQPLLVKGGMALTAFDIVASTPATGGMSPISTLFDPSTSLKLKVEAIPKKLGSNAMDLNNYKPLAYSVIAHYVAKKMHIKGL